jgi:light-harvesting complex II chlorophyll a/b binding protein 7
VRASWQEVAGVVIFSAIPFTVVKAIANSSLGEQLRFRLEQTKKSALKEENALRALSKQARETR